MVAQAPTFTTAAELPPAGPKTGAEIVEVIQGGQAVRMTTAGIAKVDRYDLLISATSGALDAAVSMNYTLDNTAATAKTITFAGFTANRAITAVIKIKGNAGNLTWPGTIVWNNSVAPTLGTTSTIVVLYWDGTEMIGMQGASV